MLAEILVHYNGRLPVFQAARSRRPRLDYRPSSVQSGNGARRLPMVHVTGTEFRSCCQFRFRFSVSRFPTCGQHELRFSFLRSPLAQFNA